MPSINAVSSTLPFAAPQRTSDARAADDAVFGTHLQTACQGGSPNGAAGAPAPTVAERAIDTASDHRASQQRLTGAPDATPGTPATGGANPCETGGAAGTTPGTVSGTAPGTATDRSPTGAAAKPASTQDAAASSSKTNSGPAQSTSATPPPDSPAAIAMDPNVSPAAARPDPDATSDAATDGDGSATQDNPAASTETPAAAHAETHRPGDETTRKIAAKTDDQDATNNTNGTAPLPAIDGVQPAPAPAIPVATEPQAGAAGARTAHAADGSNGAPDTGPTSAAPVTTEPASIAGQTNAAPTTPIVVSPDPQALQAILAPQAGQQQQPATNTAATASSPASADPAGAAAQLAGPVVSLVQAKNGASSMTVSLHPKDLGQVNIRLDRDAAGAVRVTVAATEPGTLRGLMADQFHLHAALDAAAVPNADRQIRFELAPATADTGSPNTGPGSEGGGGNDASSWRQRNDGSRRESGGGASRTDTTILPAAFTTAGVARSYRAGVNITA